MYAPYLHYSYITCGLNITHLTVYMNGKQVEVSSGKFNLSITAGLYDEVLFSPEYTIFYRAYNLTPIVTICISTSLEKIPTNNSRLILECIFAISDVVAVAGGQALYLGGNRKT